MLMTLDYGNYDIFLFWVVLDLYHQPWFRADNYLLCSGTYNLTYDVP